MATSSVSGLISGLDTDGIVTKMLEFGRRPIKLLENRKAGYNAKLAAWQEANTRLLALKMKSDAISSPAAFNARTVKVSDESLLTASVTTEAAPGSYTVTVNSLAKAQQIQSQGYADLNSTTLGTGKIKVGVGDKAKTIDIDATNNTLGGLRDAINKAGVGATASIVDLGSLNTHDYRLVLSGQTPGSSNTIAWDASALAGGTAPTWTTTNAASDASVTFGTGASATTVTKGSNSITGMIPGVTLNLKNADVGKTVEINVQADTESAKAKIKDFMTQYNGVMDFMRNQFSYDPETKASGTLLGDFTLQNVQNDLREGLLNPIPGLPAEMNSLSKIGFSTNARDQLVLDESKLSDALAADPTAVMKLFASRGESSDYSVTFLDSTATTQPTGAGAGYKVRVDQPATQTRITAGAAQTANLAADEKITINGVGIDLTQGMTPQQVADKINSYTDSTGVTAQRTAADGTGTGDFLSLKRTGFGVKGTISVSSTVSNGAGTPATDTTGIGKVQVTETAAAGETGTGTGEKGKDVAGAFGVEKNGVTTWEAASGTGQLMMGNAGNANTYGLKVQVASTTAGVHGEIKLTHGMGEILDQMLGFLTGKTGSVTTAQETLGKQIQDLNDEMAAKESRLTSYEAKLRLQFINLESTMGKIQGTGSYLSSQFASLNKSK